MGLIIQEGTAVSLGLYKELKGKVKKEYKIGDALAPRLLMEEG